MFSTTFLLQMGGVFPPMNSVYSKDVSIFSNNLVFFLQMGGDTAALSAAASLEDLQQARVTLTLTLIRMRGFTPST